MRAELKIAKREGINPKDFEAWERKHGEWMNSFIRMNRGLRGSDAERRVHAYRVWMKSYGPTKQEQEGKDLLEKIGKSV